MYQNKVIKILKDNFQYSSIYVYLFTYIINLHIEN